MGKGESGVEGVTVDGSNAVSPERLFPSERASKELSMKKNCKYEAVVNYCLINPLN